MIENPAIEQSVILTGEIPILVWKLRLARIFHQTLGYSYHVCNDAYEQERKVRFAKCRCPLCGHATIVSYSACVPIQNQ